MTPRNIPFERMEQLFENMTRQFDELSWSVADHEPLAGITSGFESMAIDVVDHDDEIVVTADLPGFDRDEIDVRLANRQLTITVDRESDHETGDEAYLRRERHHQSQSRTITLPDAVDEDSVTATMTNGVLTVTCPKLELADDRTIEIE